MNLQELVVSEKTSDASGALAREGQVAVLITQIFQNRAVDCQRCCELSLPLLSLSSVVFLSNHFEK